MDSLHISPKSDQIEIVSAYTRYQPANRWQKYIVKGLTLGSVKG
jgi:hypothetical protein